MVHEPENVGALVRFTMFSSLSTSARDCVRVGSDGCCRNETA